MLTDFLSLKFPKLLQFETRALFIKTLVETIDHGNNILVELFLTAHFWAKRFKWIDSPLSELSDAVDNFAMEHLVQNLWSI